MAGYNRQSPNFLLTPFLVEGGPFEGKEDEWFKDHLMAHPWVVAVAGQREICPTTGREHMQIFVRLDKRRRERAVVAKQLLGSDTVNVKMGDGKWDCMRSYCTWEFYPDDHVEHPGCRKRKEGCEAFDAGVWPGANGKRNDILYMVEFALEDKGSSSFAEAAYATNGAVIRYPRAYEKLLDEQGTPRDFRVRHTAVWYYGEGRIGKSFLASAENPDAYRKTTSNKWWASYKGQKTVIFDEFAGMDKGQLCYKLPTINFISS